MSSKRKMFFVFCFCILNMFLLIGFLVIRDAAFLNILKKEEKELLKLDMVSSNYKRRIKTRGSYAVVEETIKNYLNDYSLLLRENLSVMDEESLVKILSYDNYCKDGPDFNESFSYLESKKKEFNDNVEILFTRGKDNTIRRAILKEINDSYYVNLYNEFMLSSDVKEKFNESQALMSSVQVKVNRAIDGSVEVLKFLALNKDSWNVEDGEIKFLTQELYNQYMNYISKVK